MMVIHEKTLPTSVSIEKGSVVVLCYIVIAASCTLFHTA